MASSVEHVVVDLTPLLPGGENGGAKIYTLALLEHLVPATPGLTYTLLTTPANHAELSAFQRDEANVHLLPDGGNASSGSPTARARQAADILLPHAVKLQVARAYQVALEVTGKSLLRQLGADLLLCPFGAPTYHVKRCPTICMVYDLQFMSFPHFFDKGDLEQRERSFQAALKRAKFIVCLSQFTRETIIAMGGMPEQVIAIPPFCRQLPDVDTCHQARLLSSLGIAEKAFLLYPANFWPHKNHERLLRAFARYRAQYPASRLKIVLTGAEDTNSERIRRMASESGLAAHIVFAGFLPESDLVCLMKTAMALIFPSLYEGFGLPLLEAMQTGCPVLASRVAALPEVGDDAVLWFDPTDEESIKEAIGSCEANEELRQSLIRRGFSRAVAYGGPQATVDRYLSLFRLATGAAKTLSARH